LNAATDLLALLSGLPAPVDATEDAERCAGLLSALQAAIARGEGAAAMGTRVHALLDSWPAAVASAQRVECLLVVTQAQHLAAAPAAACDAAALAVALARPLPPPAQPALLRKALTFLGVSLVEDGQLPEAVQCYAEALELATALGDPLAQSSVWNNLGLALRSAALYAEAQPCFERAVAVAGQGPATLLPRRAAWCNLASCAVALRDTEAGLAAARRAIAENPDPRTPAECLSRAIAEANHVRLLCERGEVDVAQAALAQAQQLVERAPSPRADFVLQLARGSVALRVGQVEQGLALLKQHLELARRHVRSEVGEALRACIQAYEAAGQADVALVYLHELQVLHRETRAERVVQRQRAHVAWLDGRAGAVTDVAPTVALRPGTQARLRSQLGQRELLRNRILLLEQQSVAAELHDDTTGEHCYRVGRLASILGREIGLEDEVCFLIDLAARLHDIGKLVVPEAILLKPGRLTPGERTIMETHTTAGAEILARADVPQMHIAEEIARHHHERWDGTGYPMRLARSAIPIAARVTALADVFDALTHARPYKAAWPVEQALAEIARLRGLQFDPELTDVFLALVPRLQREVGDLDAHLAAEARDSGFVRARRRIAEALAGG
jgi:putative two-component system response regulator